MSAVLVDTCVWVRHFRDHNPLLAAMLEDGEVWCHPLIVGELSMGTLRNRERTIADFLLLDRPPLASFTEVRRLVEAPRLWGRGVGWNDMQILASALIGEVKLWTVDRRLGEIATELGISFGGIQQSK